MFSVLKVLIFIAHIGSPEQVNMACANAIGRPPVEGQVCAAFAELKFGVCFISLPDKDKVSLDHYIELLGHEMTHCAGWRHGPELGANAVWVGGF